MTEYVDPAIITTRKHWRAANPCPSTQLAIWLLVGVTSGFIVMLVLDVIWFIETFLYETRMKDAVLGRVD